MVQTLGAWMHDLDPFVWRISGDFGIRWYGLAYVAGFVIAWLWLRWLARRGLILIKAEAVPDVILAQVVGVMVGGRLGYVLLYDPHLLIEFGGGFPWWGALNIASGGMASHGGMVGILIAAWWSARRLRVRTLHVLDCIVAVAPVGAFLGRIANFVNGELLGRVVAGPGEAAPWWAVRYPTELLDRPTGAQVARLGEMFGVSYRETVAVIESAIAELRAGSVEARRLLEPLLSARHPSQIYQAIAEGVVVLAVVWFVWRRPRRPGVVLAAAMIAYGLGRIATEFVRLPDAHLATPRIAGLSRGQWFSVVMVVAGAALLGVVLRGSSAKVGGWRAGKGSAAGVAPECGVGE